jgi:hypothetical protein
MINNGKINIRMLRWRTLNETMTMTTGTGGISGSEMIATTRSEWQRSVLVSSRG